MADVPESYNFDAFISYRQADGAKTAQWLRNFLLDYKLPKTFGETRKLEVYLYTSYARATQDFFEETLAPALRESKFLIVVVTPRALSPPRDGARDWMAEEIRYFRDLPQGQNVLVAFGKGDLQGPLPADLHMIFPNIVRVDLRPVWSRLRSRRRSEALNVAVRLHDVPVYRLSEVREEELLRQSQQVRRQRGIVAAVAVLLAIATLVTLFSRKQVVRALASERAAEDRTKIALQEKSQALDEKTQALTERTQALDEKSRALEAERQALRERTAALTRAQVQGLLRGSEFARTDQGQLSLLLAREAVQLQGSPETLSALFEALKASRLRHVLKTQSNGRLLSVAWSRDGTRLLATGEDGRVSVWTGTGDPVASWKAHNGPVTSGIWGPGHRVVTTSEDGTAAIWEDDGRRIAVLPHTKAVTGAAWRSDGSELATSSLDGSVRIWNRDGVRLSSPSDEGAAVTSVDWHPSTSRSWLAWSSIDGKVRLWDAKHNVVMQVLEHIGEESKSGQLLAVRVVRWTNDKVVTLANDGLVRVWAFDPNKYKLKLADGGPTILRSARALANVTTDGVYMIGTSLDGSATVWLNRTGEVEFTSAPLGQNDIHNAISIFSFIGGRDVANPLFYLGSSVNDPSTGRFRLAVSDGTGRIWDLGNRKLVASLEARSGGLAWSPDGHRLASAGLDGSVRIWDTDESPYSKFNIDDGDFLSDWTDGDAGVAIHPSKPLLLRFGKRSQTVMYDLSGSELWSDFPRVSQASWSPVGDRLLMNGAEVERRSFKLCLLKEGPKLLCKEIDTPPMSEGHIFLLWNRQGSRVAAVSLGGSVSIWDNHGQLLHKSFWDTSGMRGAWNPQGDRLIIGSVHGPGGLPLSKSGVKIILLDSNGRLLQSLGTDRRSADGKLSRWYGDKFSWSCSGDKILGFSSYSQEGFRVIDKSLRVILEPPQTARIKDGLWSPVDPSRFLVFSDHAVELWLGAKRMRTIAFSDSIDSAGFSPDGQTIFVSTSQGTVSVLTTDGNLLWSFELWPWRYSTLKYDIGWMPQGQRLAVLDGQGEWGIWPGTRKELLRLGGERSLRSLTPAERQAYGLPPS